LGPWWITLGLGLQITAIGLLFGLLFQIPLDEYLPFLAVSLVVWNLIVTGINDSTSSYLQSERIIRQVRTPPLLPIVRAVGKNLIVFAHNAIILAVVLAVFGVRPGWFLLLSLIGLGFLVGNLMWLGAVFGTIGARFRDFPPIVSSVLTLSFYVTPIIWQPERLPVEFRNIVVDFNPFFHLMELVRRPLFGEFPEMESFLAALTLLVVGSGLALLVSNRFGWRIVYWL